MEKKIILLVLAALAFCPSVFAKEMASADLSGKVPSFEKADRVFQKSCFQCHSSQSSLPWYAHTPGVKQLLKKEYLKALTALDFDSEVYVQGQPPSKKALDKIEYAVRKGSMPPKDYVLTHWRAKVGTQKKQDILNWIQDERSKIESQQIQKDPVSLQAEQPKSVESQPAEMLEKPQQEHEVYNPFKPR